MSCMVSWVVSPKYMSREGLALQVAGQGNLSHIVSELRYATVGVSHPRRMKTPMDIITVVRSDGIGDVTKPEL